jgi:glycosyltransferase involved in cell wall biosynthesis
VKPTGGCTHETPLRIAVAHEWLTNWAGSERVMEQLVAVTGAETLVSCVVEDGLARSKFPDLAVRALWPTHLPGAQDKWARYALPMIAAWATTRIDADALLVSSHFAAHAATRRFRGPSIVYYHTPARILWRPDLELGRVPYPLRSIVQALVLPALRRWDRAMAQGATILLANSTAVARRVSRAYGREARVLHPPVDVARWSAVQRAQPMHAVWFGRLVSYKRPDVAVEAARRSGVPLVVIGDGPERTALERTAPPHVTFLGHAPESRIREVLAHASALVVPGEEDFGICPIECLAAGVPVLAFASGGVLDYVRHDVNGLLLDSQDPDTFARAMREASCRVWDVDRVRRSAGRFAAERFREGLRDILDDVLGPRWMRQVAP